MKKRSYTKPVVGKQACTVANGFTIVEIVVTVALAGLFVGVFVAAAQAYQTVRLETQRKTEAYSVAQQLALNSRGATSESLSCSTTTRQTITENQPIPFDTAASGGIKGDEALLINPQYSLYGEYLNGCSGDMRVIVRVTYGAPSKRENVETIAL